MFTIDGKELDSFNELINYLKTNWLFWYLTIWDNFERIITDFDPIDNIIEIDNTYYLDNNDFNCLINS